jgi:hypothetical protein
MTMAELKSLRDQQYFAMKNANIKLEGEAILIVSFTALAHGFLLSSQMTQASTKDSFRELNELYMWGINWAVNSKILSDDGKEVIRKSLLDSQSIPTLWSIHKFTPDDSNLNSNDSKELQKRIYEVLLKHANKCRGKTGELQKRRKILVKELKRFGVIVQTNDTTDELLFSLCTGFGLIVGDTFTDVYGDRPARRDAGAFWTSFLLTRWLGKQKLIR